jgi:Flp pilus assembly pilin Flp
VLWRTKEAVYAFVARAHGLLLTERGQTLAEYGLIITLVAVGVIVPTTLIFRDQLIGAFNSATPCLMGGC